MIRVLDMTMTESGGTGKVLSRGFEHRTRNCEVSIKIGNLKFYVPWTCTCHRLNNLVLNMYLLCRYTIKIFKLFILIIIIIIQNFFVFSFFVNSCKVLYDLLHIALQFVFCVCFGLLHFDGSHVFLSECGMNVKP